MSDNEDIEKLIADAMKSMKDQPGVAMDAGAKFEKGGKITAMGMPHTPAEIMAAIKDTSPFPLDMSRKYPDYVNDFLVMAHALSTFMAAFTALNAAYGDDPLSKEKRQLLFNCANQLCNHAANALSHLQVVNIKISEPEDDGNMKIKVTIGLDEDKYPPKEPTP